MGRVKEKKNVVFVYGKNSRKTTSSRVVLDILKKAYTKKEPKDGKDG